VILKVIVENMSFRGRYKNNIY